MNHPKNPPHPQPIINHDQVPAATRNNSGRGAMVRPIPVCPDTRFLDERFARSRLIMNAKYIQAIRDFLLEEDGPTAVEYAVMLALIVAVCMGSVQFLTAKTKESFDDTGTAISGAFN